jgi:23S rRNA pseudouridine1911/1915/1917 synthase
MLRHGRIRVNGTPITRFDHQLHPGDRVSVARNPSPAASLLAAADIKLVALDQHIIVIDKPPGLLSVATGSEKARTAFAMLNEYLRNQGEGRPFVVHRLDRETSGLLMFARSAEVRAKLQADWQSIAKTYVAVVEGQPKPPSGTIENHLVEGRDLRVRAARSSGAAKSAITRYRVITAGADYTLVELLLETGRKHQIRVHLAGLGCPVAGDRLYGARTDPFGRLGLHAWRLAFPHPVSGSEMNLESPPPASFRQFLA